MIWFEEEYHARSSCTVNMAGLIVCKRVRDRHKGFYGKAGTRDNGRLGACFPGAWSFKGPRTEPTAATDLVMTLERNSEIETGKGHGNGLHCTGTQWDYCTLRVILQGSRTFSKS